MLHNNKWSLQYCNFKVSTTPLQLQLKQHLPHFPTILLIKRQQQQPQLKTMHIQYASNKTHHQTCHSVQQPLASPQAVTKSQTKKSKQLNTKNQIQKHKCMSLTPCKTRAWCNIHQVALPLSPTTQDKPQGWRTWTYKHNT